MDQHEMILGLGAEAEIEYLPSLGPIWAPRKPLPFGGSFISLSSKEVEIPTPAGGLP